MRWMNDGRNMRSQIVISCPGWLVKKIVVLVERQFDRGVGFAAEENARAWRNEDHTDGRDLRIWER